MPSAPMQFTSPEERAAWADLSDPIRLSITRRAMADAAATLAGHAEIVAREMEEGRLADRGGPAALRLYAALIRDYSPVVERCAGQA